MKLFEIVKKPPICQAMDIMLNYVVGWGEHHQFDRAIDMLLDTNQYTYEGKMFRYIKIPDNLLQSDLRLVVAQLHEYDTKNKRKYFSWSKSVTNKPVTALGANCIVFEQTGKALDPILVVQNPPNGCNIDHRHDPYDPEEEKKDPNYHQNRKEYYTSDINIQQEILAPLTNNMHPIGLWAKGKQYYSIDQYREFLQNVKVL